MDDVRKYPRIPKESYEVQEEYIQQPVDGRERWITIARLPSVVPTMEFIGELLQMAYIAGWNQVNIRGGIKNIEDTGQARTFARNYARDKGFPI